jgi:predicted oxidoreductase
VTGILVRELASRDEIVLANAILIAINNSLRRLSTDHVDLLSDSLLGPDTPVEKTMEALRGEGRLRSLSRRFFDVRMALCQVSRKGSIRLNRCPVIACR